MNRRSSHLISPSNLMIALLFTAIPYQSVWAKHPHYADQISMEAEAFMGPDGTELVLRFVTSDPENFPIPVELEKLKVKYHGGGHGNEHGHGNILDERDVPLEDNQILLPLWEAPLHALLNVEARLRTGGKKVKLKSDVRITLRPDLIIESVGYPASVIVGRSFNIDVNLQEMLGDNGAIANVTLSADGIAMTTPEVHVNSEALTTVVFGGLSFSTDGLHEITAVISDAVPAEYDLTNNTVTFDIDVILPPTPGETEYFMNYLNFTNHNTGFSNQVCGVLETKDYSGDRDQFSFSGYSPGDAPGGSIDVSFSLYADGVWSYAVDVEGLTPYAIVNGEAYYMYSDTTTGTLITYTYYPTGVAEFEIKKYSGREVIFHSIDGVSTTVQNDYGSYMNAHNSVEFSVLIENELALIGGTASIELYPPESFDYSTTYTQTVACGVNSYTNYEYGDIIFGFFYGLWNPAVLPKHNHAETAELMLPKSVFLSENYPNPFNPTTTISFGLPEAGQVRMQVYDIKGRLVLTLAEGFYPAGQHDLLLDASQLSSGTYFYSLQTGASKEIKRMLLLK